VQGSYFKPQYQKKKKFKTILGTEKDLVSREKKPELKKKKNVVLVMPGKHLYYLSHISRPYNSPYLLSIMSLPSVARPGGNMPRIPALGRLREDNCEFEASLENIECPRLI
jgi:hypothetical protein